MFNKIELSLFHQNNILTYKLYMMQVTCFAHAHLTAGICMGHVQCNGLYVSGRLVIESLFIHNPPDILLAFRSVCCHIHFAWIHCELHRVETPVAVAYSGCTHAGPSSTEDVSDIVTGKRRRQHIDYKVVKCSQAAATCFLHFALSPCHAVNAPSPEF